MLIDPSQVVPSVSISYVVYEHSKRWYFVNASVDLFVID